MGIAGEVIVGYHALTAGQVILGDAPDRLKKGLTKHPTPIMLLARLAIDRRWQGRGVGQALLRDAMQRTLQAADIAGIRVLAVHAKDEEARRFYEHFDFAPSPRRPHAPIRVAQRCAASPLNVRSPPSASNVLLSVPEHKGERRSGSHKRLLYCVNVNRTSLDHLLLGKNADVDQMSNNPSIALDQINVRRLESQPHLR